MLRSLVLPAACAALLAGCATGYSYRADRGDYYYGAPEVEYRYHGVPGGYGYGGYGAYGYYGPYRRVPGYGHYGYGGYPYGYGGYPYGYGGYGGYYGWPYSGYPRHVVRPRPRPPTEVTPRETQDGAPWRNFDDLRRRRGGDDVARRAEPSASQPRMERPRPSRDGGLGGMLRETRERRGESPVASEQAP